MTPALWRAARHGGPHPAPQAACELAQCGAAQLLRAGARIVI
jgi:hypothetical protein